MSIFNQYSFVWLSVFLAAIIGVILLRRQPRWPQFLAFGALLLGLLLAWIILHPRQTSSGIDASQVRGSIGQGIPVLLEFQSLY